MPEPVHTDIPITTALELPGRPAGQSLGLVFGLVVRSMGFVKGFTAGFSALRKGEVTQYTEVLEDARRHAIDRMVANARLIDADGAYWPPGAGARAQARGPQGRLVALPPR
jgi:uncharacterized protein YbjQ (UPF0145 family)